MNRFTVFAIAALLALAGCGVFVISRADTPKTTPPASVDFPPASKKLHVTIPALDVIDAPTFYAPAHDESALRHGLMHVKGTGFPWERGANVYLAGHDLGFPGTRSWRIFWELRSMEPGDRVFIEDADKTRYTYRVYEQEIIQPHETRVLLPVGKSIVTLQSCVPHFDWSERLIVRGELVNVSEARS